jgi:cysteine-rich repeat protein
MLRRALLPELLALLVLGALACGTNPPNPVEGSCGDGIVDPGEQCDPPDAASCSATCQIVNPSCGDGILDAGEDCDDANTVGGDGCRANCTDEECGDFIQDPQETCDDGNTTPTDGCSASCQDESAGESCGDGVRDFGEECDDGDLVNGDGCSGACKVEPPAGISLDQARGFELVNDARASAGLPGMSFDTALGNAAQSHSIYFVLNPTPFDNGLNPHEEDPNFSAQNSFTGVNFFNRTQAAGFSGQTISEVMVPDTFGFGGDNPDVAVGVWVNSVFHRAPILHPNVAEMGFGNAAGQGRAAAVIDFGAGPSEDPLRIVLFPAPNAIGVAREFSGNEGPRPPDPPGGFPSGPIVSLHFDLSAQVTITEHRLFDEVGTELAHAFVSPQTAGLGPFMMNSVAFYAKGPAPSNATFRARVSGTLNGQPFTREWSFTTE